jgi:hypothetical protein
MVETFLLIIRRHNYEDPDDDDLTLCKETGFRSGRGMSEEVETATKEEERELTDEDIEVIRNVYVEQEEWIEREIGGCLSGEEEEEMRWVSWDEMDEEEGCWE